MTTTIGSFAQKGKGYCQLGDSSHDSSASGEHLGGWADDAV
ncbi:hypothetical protein ACR9WD_07510 [Glutamicibacter sp. PAEs-4]|nr:hypothetical protein [Glutamicibacter sp. ZJUTW]